MWFYRTSPFIRSVARCGSSSLNNINRSKWWLFSNRHCSMETGSERPDEQTNSNVVKEGKAEVFSPSSVFYNPVQQFNRDLTINVITQFARDLQHERKEKETAKALRKRGQLKENLEKDPREAKCDNEDIADPKVCSSDACEKQGNSSGDKEVVAGQHCPWGIRILEALAASGLRSIRFALEIPGVQQIVTNDLDKTAVEYIKRNVEHNGVKDLVTASLADATILMYQHRDVSKRFDVIDLDPYGSASIFLDSTVQAIQDGGLLCITCTDMAVICGNVPETCHSKYGSVAFKSPACHEIALRILLQSIESAANRYGRYITPLISISVDFYIRVFVRVNSGAHIVKNSVTKFAHLYQCVECKSHNLHPIANKVETKGGGYKFVPASAPSDASRCPNCGGRYNIGGPVWGDRIHDMEFVQRVLTSAKKNKDKFGTGDRLMGMLSMIAEEMEDVPLYYVIDSMCKVMHCEPPPMLTFRSAILNAGYQVTSSHAARNSIKTDAPASVIWDLLRCWVKDHPVGKKWLQDGSTAKSLLDKSPAIEASFEMHEDANPESRRKGLVRWQTKPERDWGPKARARHGKMETLDERRIKGAQKAREKREKRKMQDETTGEKVAKLDGSDVESTSEEDTENTACNMESETKD